MLVKQVTTVQQENLKSRNSGMKNRHFTSVSGQEGLCTGCEMTVLFILWILFGEIIISRCVHFVVVPWAVNVFVRADVT